MESIADEASSTSSEESPVSSPRELGGISYKTISTKGKLSSFSNDQFRFFLFVNLQSLQSHLLIPC